MDKWLQHRPRGLGIMPLTPDNADYSNLNVIKYDRNLEEIVDVMENAFAREAKSCLVLS